MSETNTNKRGGSRPNTGGKREGAGRKALGSSPRSQTVSVRVETDIADWLRINGGSAKHYEILRKAFSDELIV